MTTPGNRPAPQRQAPAHSPVLAPSGKSEKTENFPVGSWLIAADLRPHVAAYYAWARAIDDIADDPRLNANEKLKRLDLLELALAGAMGRDNPELSVAWCLRESLLSTGRPLCGRLKKAQLEHLFGDQAAALESAAVVPLGEKAGHGLLAIGSCESIRFHPGMGTLFLSNLGELLGQLLASR